jgi:UrcA family protein
MEPNMTRTFGYTLLALGLQLFSVGSAQATSLGEEEITVAGPYTVSKEMTKRPLGGEMPEFTVSVSQHVNYADLDLSKPDGVAKLRDRVTTAAKDSCRELDSRFPRNIYHPVGESSRRECVRNTTGQTLARLDTVTNGALARADASNNNLQVAAR